LNISFGLDVARSAISYSARNAFFFSSQASPIKVTNETVGLVNGEMSSLDKLSMTAGASKFRPSSQFPQMPCMRKAYILEYHIPF
jgi:hypothetical protein